MEDNNGLVFMLTDAVIDHLVALMGEDEVRETCRRLLREARDGGRMDTDSYATLAYLRVERDWQRREVRAAVGTPLPAGLPEPGEQVQIVINATLGAGRDRWIVEGPMLFPRMLTLGAAAAWRPAWAGSEAALARAVAGMDADELRREADHEVVAG